MEGHAGYLLLLLMVIDCWGPSTSLPRYGASLDAGRAGYNDQLDELTYAQSQKGKKRPSTSTGEENRVGTAILGSMDCPLTCLCVLSCALDPVCDKCNTGVRALCVKADQCPVAKTDFNDER